MKKSFIYLSKVFVSIILALFLFSCSSSDGGDDVNTSDEPSLKNGIGKQITIGVAVNMDQVNGVDAKAQELIINNFNSIEPSNCMKSESIHPEENRYFWDDADKFVQFGLDHNMFIVGHCLIWHSQLAPWFCVDENGNNVSAEVLKQRMKDHITTIMTRYKGKVDAWDVVNEAVIWTGAYRDSPFYQILGEEYIPYAFKCAHEADPDAELYYNDYSLYMSVKQDQVLHIVQTIKDYPGAQIDGIGYQCHVDMETPSAAELQATIDKLSTSGCKIMASEFDMSALPTPSDMSEAGIAAAEKNFSYYNPYPLAITDEAQAKWDARLEELFNVFLANTDKVKRINIWGVTDKSSWKNNYPIPGRTDYPTLFDRFYTPKASTETFMK